jgi:predicted pyridoxine 5'-phosphate oxidase superfamily flavin-nucleotide-binding protein
MLDHRILKPFHEGELHAQQLAGGGPAGAPIRAQMPDQHRTFFPLLPFLCVALRDETGWPLATLLHGEPGFVSSPEATRLDIAALPAVDDPACPYVASGVEIGMLGIDLATRRRNRANGTVIHTNAQGLSVNVRQSFGNCPKYIRVRQVSRVNRERSRVSAFDGGMPTDAVSLIARSETMFVATSSGASAQHQACGLDISHRGGPPGFLRINGNVLTIPDYAGNRYFNTLGNLLLEPRASLVLADFDAGDILQLQGVAEVSWQRGVLADDPQVERSWTFRVVRGWLRRATFPFNGT